MLLENNLGGYNGFEGKVSHSLIVSARVIRSFDSYSFAQVPEIPTITGLIVVSSFEGQSV